MPACSQLHPQKFLQLLRTAQSDDCASTIRDRTIRTTRSGDCATLHKQKFLLLLLPNPATALP